MGRTWRQWRGDEEGSASAASHSPAGREQSAPPRKRADGAGARETGIATWCEEKWKNLFGAWNPRSGVLCVAPPAPWHCLYAGPERLATASSGPVGSRAEPPQSLAARSSRHALVRTGQPPARYQSPSRAPCACRPHPRVCEESTIQVTSHSVVMAALAESIHRRGLGQVWPRPAVESVAGSATHAACDPASRTVGIGSHCQQPTAHPHRMVCAAFRADAPQLAVVDRRSAAPVVTGQAAHGQRIDAPIIVGTPPRQARATVDRVRVQRVGTIPAPLPVDVAATAKTRRLSAQVEVRLAGALDRHSMSPMAGQAGDPPIFQRQPAAARRSDAHRVHRQTVTRRTMTLEASVDIGTATIRPRRRVRRQNQDSGQQECRATVRTGHGPTPRGASTDRPTSPPRGPKILPALPHSDPHARPASAGPRAR